MSKYGHRPYNWHEAIANKLGGEEACERFLRGELVVTEADPPIFPTWKTITVGTKSPEEYRKALSEGGFRIGDWGNNILGRLPSPSYSEDTKVGLIIVSVAELGFKEGARRRDIYKKAQGLGLELAPPEVGPELRLQYPDQPKGEWLLIAMEPITTSIGYPYVFRVDADGHGRWLRGGGSEPDRFLNGDRRWVFIRRK